MLTNSGKCNKSRLNYFNSFLCRKSLVDSVIKPRFMDYINTQQFLYDAYILGEEVQFQYITLFIVMIMS